jgi:hypothetical protein
VVAVTAHPGDVRFAVATVESDRAMLDSLKNPGEKVGLIPAASTMTQQEWAQALLSWFVSTRGEVLPNLWVHIHGVQETKRGGYIISHCVVEWDGGTVSLQLRTDAWHMDRWSIVMNEAVVTMPIIVLDKYLYSRMYRGG